MIKSAFSHVTDWIFDLDHTLYPAENGLFSQIEVKMTDYLVALLNITRDEANSLRTHYWHTYGTTLAGLMKEHDVTPDPFLEQVHDIDFSVLSINQDLNAMIARLPGRKLIYTNGTLPYAQRVLTAVGLEGAFDAIYGVEHANYRPKPESAAYSQIIKQANIPPKNATMFEDSVANLRVPHDLGMKTVLVHTTEDTPSDHIHFQTNNLAEFLRQIV